MLRGDKLPAHNSFTWSTLPAHRYRVHGTTHITGFVSDSPPVSGQSRLHRSAWFAWRLIDGGDYAYHAYHNGDLYIAYVIFPVSVSPKSRHGSTWSECMLCFDDHNHRDCVPLPISGCTYARPSLRVDTSGPRLVKYQRCP